MPYAFAYRRYRLPLRHVVRTAHEVWTEREGLLLRIEDPNGVVAIAEAAPIPAFGTETVAEAEEICRTLGDRFEPAHWNAIGTRFGCVRSALATALEEVERNARHEKSPEAAATPAAYRAVAALLPTGRAALKEVANKAEAGFRVFKWKVGVADSAEELGWLDDLCAALPNGAKLRLDANGAWDRRVAERWLERCAERPIEFVEQPCFVSRSDGEAAKKRAEDTLLGLAQEYPTPIALDESVVSDGDIERWLGAGWPGWFVIKPTLIGDVKRAVARLTAARATVVFSSALETAVAAKSALRVAFGWQGEAKALGFGVWPLFADARFDGPAVAPFLRPEDVERIDPAAIWNALS